MSDYGFEIITESAEETNAVGAILANWVREGDVLLLHGDLGAGKTTLTKGIAAALRVDAVVASPSFALVNEYDAGLAAPVTRLYHLDLYRLTNSDDLATIGFADLVAPVDGVTLVEWPERALDDLPERYLLIEIESAGVERRRLHVVPVPDDKQWSSRITDLRERLAEFMSE
jgi:tRNA threonylcarbamoyladenosine biosynthesis protein TsaE